MKLLAFAASHRPESLNYKLVKLAAEFASSFGAEVEIVDFGEFDMPLYNDTLSENPPVITKIFAEKCKDKNGIIIAMPEYNWSFPASLKNIIDWTSIISPPPLSGKTIFLMSATTGARGGIAGLQQLKSPMEALHGFIFHKVFPLSHAQYAFNEGGNLKDEKQREVLCNQIKDYIEFTRRLSYH